MCTLLFFYFCNVSKDYLLILILLNYHQNITSKPDVAFASRNSGWEKALPHKAPAPEHGQGVPASPGQGRSTAPNKYLALVVWPLRCHCPHCWWPHRCRCQHQGAGCCWWPELHLGSAGTSPHLWAQHLCLGTRRPTGQGRPGHCREAPLAAQPAPSELEAHAGSLEELRKNRKFSPQKCERSNLQDRVRLGELGVFSLVKRRFQGDHRVPSSAQFQAVGAPGPLEG